MNISNYMDYFHDGSIIDIQYIQEALLISMESAEIIDDTLSRGIQLSKRSNIKGILHLNNISMLMVDKQPIAPSQLNMFADCGNIIRFEINHNCVFMFIEWINFPPHVEIEKYSEILAEAKEMFWENMPDLFDPYAL